MIYCFEDLDIKLLRFWRVEWHAQRHERVGEALYTDTDGTVAEVGSTGFRDGVIVDVDDAIEVICDGLGDGVELLKVIFAIGDEGGESERGKVAYGGLVRDEYSMISVQRLEDLMVLTFCWLDLAFAASLYTMNGPPVSICASRIAYHNL